MAHRWLFNSQGAISYYCCKVTQVAQFLRCMLKSVGAQDFGHFQSSEQQADGYLTGKVKV